MALENVRIWEKSGVNVTYSRSPKANLSRVHFSKPCVTGISDSCLMLRSPAKFTSLLDCLIATNPGSRTISGRVERCFKTRTRWCG